MTCRWHVRAAPRPARRRGIPSAVFRVAGENRFTIAPRPGGHFTRAGAKYNSVYGLVESRWEKKDGKTVYTIVVPANCEAEIVLPGGTRETVAAGKYSFEG